MKKFTWMTILVLAAGLCAVPAPASAQDMQKKETAKAQPGESQIVLGQWNEIARKLIAMAEDFPEDKYDYKPTPAQRSFAEQLLHAAGAVNFFTGPVQGQTPAEEDPPRAKYKTKADVVAFVKKSLRRWRRGDQIERRQRHGRLGHRSGEQAATARFGSGLWVDRAFGRALRATGGLLPFVRAGAAGIASQEITKVANCFCAGTIEFGRARFYFQAGVAAPAAPFSSRASQLRRITGGRQAGLTGANERERLVGGKMRQSFFQRAGQMRRSVPGVKRRTALPKRKTRWAASSSDCATQLSAGPVTTICSG